MAAELIARHLNSFLTPERNKRAVVLTPERNKRAVDLKREPSSGQNVYQGLIETIRRLDRIGDKRGLNHVI